MEPRLHCEAIELRGLEGIAGARRAGRYGRRDRALEDGSATAGSLRREDAQQRHQRLARRAGEIVENQDLRLLERCIGTEEGETLARRVGTPEQARRAEQLRGRRLAMERDQRVTRTGRDGDAREALLPQPGGHREDDGARGVPAAAIFASD